MDNEKKTIFWDASEVFTQLSDVEFNNLVLPFIKAYYKKEFDGELYVNWSNDSRDLAIVVNCNRNESKISYYYDIENCEHSNENIIENDLKNLKVKDIYNFLIYEYKLFFRSDKRIDDKINNKIKKDVML